MTEKKRYHLLDFIRGICILLVVWYHALYNLSEVFGQKYEFFGSLWLELFRISFVSALILISGISCSLSRSNLKRGVKTLLCGLLITAVTLVFMPSQRILFGILHFFGLSMLLFALLRKPIEKLPAIPLSVISLAAFVLTYRIYYLDAELPYSFLLFILGFNTNFFSADYYPIIPWFFLFLSGAALGIYFKEGRVPKIFEANPIKPISFIGRHTLFIYLIHQTLLYGGMYLWFCLL